MKLALIAAMDENQVIGIDNQLPWHLPADLKFFKKVTLGKPIIMGRKTFESIGKILPGRQNIVVTTNTSYSIKAPVPDNASLEIVTSLKNALEISNTFEEVMLIGGSRLFKEALPLADTLYLTFIHAKFAGDTFFPEINLNNWQQVWREDHKKDAVNAYDYSFVKLARLG